MTNTGEHVGINSFNRFINNAKTKALEFSDQLSAHPAVRYLKQKEAAIANRVDALPPAAIKTLHLIPLVGIAAHFLKEKALNNRLPDLHEHTKATFRCETLQKQVKDLRNQSDFYKKNIAAMQGKREAFLELPPLQAKGIAGVKAKMARKIEGWQVAESKIKALIRDQGKAQKKLESLKLQLHSANKTVRRCNNCLADPEIDQQVEAIRQERQELRKTFRVGLVVLTAVTVAAVALAAFSLIPAAIGYAGMLAVGISFGVHLALCKSDQWNQEGRLSFKNAHLDT